MDSNTLGGLKRPTNCDLDLPSPSKLPKIARTSSTVAIVAPGSGEVTIGAIHVPRHQQLQAPRDIEFQVPDPVDTFRGREETFHEVKQVFDQQKGKKPYNLVAVCGYGGIGKTQFVRMYIKMNRKELNNVVWINAESETTMKSSFEQLRNKLTDRGDRCYSDQDVYEHLNNEFTLFVFDGSKDIRSIHSFLPAKQNSSLFLVTSRSKDWNGFNAIELEELRLMDAEYIMKTILVKKKKIEISDKQLLQVMKKFDFVTIPLFLQVNTLCIARILKSRQTQCNIEDVIDELNIDHDYTREIVVLSQRFEKLQHDQTPESKIALKILATCTYLSADCIKINVLLNLLDIKDDLNIFKESLRILKLYSIIQIFNNEIQIRSIIQDNLKYFFQVDFQLK